MLLEGRLSNFVSLFPLFLNKISYMFCRKEQMSHFTRERLLNLLTQNITNAAAFRFISSNIWHLHHIGLDTCVCQQIRCDNHKVHYLSLFFFFF